MGMGNNKLTPKEQKMKTTMTGFLTLIAMLFASPAFAVHFYDNSDVSVAQSSEVKCGPNISCALSSGKLLLKSTSTQVAVTGNATITAAQCGSTFVSSATGVLTLPEASTVLGCRISVVCGTTDDVDLNPADTTDVIGIAGSITGSNTTTTIAPSAGDAIRCTDVGAGFTVEAVGANLWAVLRTTGVITDVN